MPRKGFLCTCMYKELETLYERVLKPIVIRIKESWVKSVIFIILIYVVVMPLLDATKYFFITYPYGKTYNSIILLLKTNLRIYDYFTSGYFVLSLGLFFYFFKQLQKATIFRENFKKELNSWSIPTDSAWTIQKCSDKPGKMLSVTNSAQAGTLKEIYQWFDYEITLLFKMKGVAVGEVAKDCSVLVRAENNSNGILMKITTEEFQPYILFNGSYILDDDNVKRLPTVLETDVWHPLKISVKGDNVDITVAGYKLHQYRIQTKNFFVEEKIINKIGSLRLKEIIESDLNINGFLNKWYGALDDWRNEKNEEEKRRLGIVQEEAWQEYKKIKYQKITFEYQKGSIGFRAVDLQQTYFKDLVVKKI